MIHRLLRWFRSLAEHHRRSRLRLSGPLRGVLVTWTHPTRGTLTARATEHVLDGNGRTVRLVVACPWAHGRLILAPRTDPRACVAGTVRRVG
jgi:hypothetical protein